MITPPSQLKRLLNVALITSPVIAALLVTPLYLVSGLQHYNIEVLVPAAIIIVFSIWCIQIAFIQLFPKLKNWQRLIIVIAIGLVLSTIVFELANPSLPFALWKIHLARSLNVISINSIIYILSNYIILNQTKKKLDQENEALKFANLEARYQTLRNQINPHFLFNAIGTAKSLIRKNPSIADEYLVRLSHFLRLGFDNKMNTISVQGELDLCKDYIDLQKMRFGAALEFTSNIDAGYLGYTVPYFALLSLAENAVKHNTMTETEPLSISIKNENNLLIIQNNVQPKFLLGTSSKTGLHNLSERYRLLFNEPVTIENTATYFRVSIKMIRP